MAVQLLGPAQVRALAERHGVTPTKRLGQNFVIDANTIRRIVAAAGVRADDRVLEVGPGLGSLTLGLLEVADDVTVVELDPGLAGALPGTIAEQAPGRSVRVIRGDAAKVTAADWAEARDDRRTAGADDGPTAVVANLPYNVAVPIMLHLLETFPSIRRVLVMVQSEVADRVAAAPGSKIYGVPSVKAAWYGPWRLAGSVGKHVFWPAPNVTSGLLAGDIRPIADRPGGETLRLSTFRAVDAAFAQRRKTLRQSLAGLVDGPHHAEALLRSAGVDPGLRAERLGLDEFVAIGRALAAR
ncbi:16S rRNA (adenine(1518)-N(6)/adenine(1519)-N(6))-dimethyltransferase RsmA [Pseudoclavibacter sp. 13-3]|uniref:16S rRNA (adenine(1518)-N(6)/adenine(1519)-N(6))- dimethyltransferase RsmA n=1 Tax=Pseudoclavibacter sp. 13-3 TaxID=2901228 RepID=UPI001E28C443|nr:16S rRNA (adenine(1518)-N(6)/adenine(1519)-N(6))-dimethyltransferase RsmA [Pseudoclavibacter sp. 13-3]MCD7101852.1 16S rRNA (adenine(1518)-N(6)/adenine(1519)-N(6))-dimethyltransferase RsmA [Pseudoclavibacter sp. 13-3]